MALAEQPAREPLEKDGLGWRFNPAEAPVTFGFSRIVERSSEITAELHVQSIGNGERQHVLRRRVNLLGSRTPADLAKDLDLATDAAGWPWRKIVESAFASVIEAHREGESEQRLGGRKVAPPSPRHLVDGLLIANVANTWFGPGGTGKSTVAVAACVAHEIGYPLVGRSVEKGTALYLDWEDEEEAFERILWEVSRGYGLEESARVYWRRMKAPLKDDIAYISALIDRIGATLVVIDSATRAMGSAGEHGTYESTAVAFAEGIRALGKVTTLILDHVDGASVKEGGVAKKAYGSIHKLNFVRNAWSLSPDDDASEQTVGWTHAKVNHGPKLPPFGVRYERDPVIGGLELVVVEAGDMPMIAKTLPQWKQMTTILDRTGPLEVKALAAEMFGRDDDRACGQVRSIFNRDHGKNMVRLPDGRLKSRTWTGAKRNAETSGSPERNIRLVTVSDGDPDPLPF